MDKKQALKDFCKEAKRASEERVYLPKHIEGGLIPDKKEDNKGINKDRLKVISQNKNGNITYELKKGINYKVKR